MLTEHSNIAKSASFIIGISMKKRALFVNKRQRWKIKSGK